MNWKAYVVGDIFVGSTDNPVIATWFGGNNDPDDDGETASGINTKDNPDVMGCALPIPTCDTTKQSPLPILPYKDTLIEIWARDYSTPDNTTGFSYTIRTITVPLIDVGPALDTNHAIDLTIAAFQKLGGDIAKGRLEVAYCIKGAAKYLIS